MTLITFEVKSVDKTIITSEHDFAIYTMSRNQMLHTMHLNLCLFLCMIKCH